MMIVWRGPVLSEVEGALACDCHWVEQPLQRCDKDFAFCGL